MQTVRMNVPVKDSTDLCMHTFPASTTTMLRARRRSIAFLLAVTLLIQCAKSFLPSAQVQHRRAPPRHSRPLVATSRRVVQHLEQRDVLIPLQASNNNENFPDGGNGVNDMDPGLKLLICILIDLIGVASFAAPGLGEATDIGWAPISAFLVNYLFGNGVFTALALVEELLPGFDIIPTATIAWFVENANREEEVSSSATGSTSSAAPTPTNQNPQMAAKRSNPPSDAIDVEVTE